MRCTVDMVASHFTELICWQLADELRREVIACTDSGLAPKDFKYRDQIRDASASVCRNTAEGFDRFRPPEFVRFLDDAKGSLGEIQDQLIDGHGRRYLDDECFNRMWVLSKRAKGANVGLRKCLKDCIATGREPWLEGRRHEPTSGNQEPRTKNPGT
jgi:four helix bundle protein